jgi:glycosyltransferase involved in cell wall biosynthesis
MKTVMQIRLAYFVSHPIQYQCPLLRRIALEADIDLKAFFSSDLSVRGYLDPGFGVRVQWDVPLLDGYKYEFLPRFRETDRVGFFKPINWGILSRLRRDRFDAVWVSGYNSLTCLNAIFAAKILGLPVIMRGESNLHSRVRSKRTLAAKRMLAPVLRRAISCAVSIGSANDQYWKYYFGEDFPTFSMPYAVDNGFFRQKVLDAAQHREVLRREIGLDPNRPVILFASKLQARKRCIDLVEAYVRLRPAPGFEPDAYLLIVGDGEERARLETRVRESGLSRIRFLGFRNQTELPALYDLSDVFVLPSVYEPWGLVVNEVMNAGRPIIVTDGVGCQAELVHDGFNGFVYPASDIDALSDCLHRLITDPALRGQMGKNSLRLIEQYGFEQDVTGLRQALAFAVRGFVA